MEKKQTAKYIISDTLSAMLAWAALFLFRKLALEHTGFSDVADACQAPLSMEFSR